MSSQFTIKPGHRSIQCKLQAFVRAIYEVAHITDKAIITDAIADTLNCSVDDIELCLGKDTGLVLSELRGRKIDLERLKKMFCSMYPPELRKVHIEGAVIAELEQIEQMSVV